MDLNVIHEGIHILHYIKGDMDKALLTRAQSVVMQHMFAHNSSFMHVCVCVCVCKRAFSLMYTSIAAIGYIL